MTEEPIKILIVEDYEKDRASFRDVLDRPEYRFAEAERGEDGLILLEREHFDLLIVDIGLPGMNGLEFVRQARRRELTSAPVIVITGEPNSAYEKEAWDLGVLHYFIKDELTNPDLRQAVIEAVTKRATA
jgi:DNA-binding response OmpR family regulator